MRSVPRSPFIEPTPEVEMAYQRAAEKALAQPVVSWQMAILRMPASPVSGSLPPKHRKIKGFSQAGCCKPGQARPSQVRPSQVRSGATALFPVVDFHAR